MNPLKTSNQQWTILAATVVWGLAVAGGLLALQLHGASPGQSGSALDHWPSPCRIPLAGGRPTLIVAVHALCPCTPSSVAELGARLLIRCEGQVEVYVLIFRPRRVGHGWDPTDGCAPLGITTGVHHALLTIPQANKRPASVLILPAWLRYTLEMGDSFFAAASRVPGVTRGITRAGEPFSA